ncbi:phage scaffolding protein [Paenibacillus sp. HN-1]|uniref:phage scaffolding protein n=1 Tax=Paenibacillus TaxID=44249 RepID=UPI001CA8F45E|nr:MULTISPECIES: phage scaffolding protein [Paenibacillus]MBY9078297.1 phage scaffolding protein [Paenibacillus sp. CGMCC 1.18879]MBY9086044.1 phage scaffolding protein [Paenibacillus sinensis]
MNKEQFVALGLTDDLATKAAAASTDELKSFVPKARFDEVNDAKKQAEQDRDKVSGQLEELKKSAGDNEALKKQIETLQGENKTTKEQYDAKVKDLQLTTAIKLALSGQAHDPDIVAGLLDKSKIELDDSGSVKGGLDDQVKALRDSKGFLFAPKEDKKPQFRGAKPPEGGDPNGGGAGEASVGANFAKAANESGKPAAGTPNPWG